MTIVYTIDALCRWDVASDIQSGSLRKPRRVRRSKAGDDSEAFGRALIVETCERAAPTDATDEVDASSA